MFFLEPRLRGGGGKEGRGGKGKGVRPPSRQLWTRHCLSCDSVRVTRPINADTQRTAYLPNGKAYELQTRYTDGGRRSASSTGANDLQW